MEVVISLVLTVIGTHFGNGDIDFFALFTFISAALQLYRAWIDMRTLTKCVILKYIRKNTECRSVKEHSQNKCNKSTKDNR